MDPYLALKVVLIATFYLLKRSKSVYLTFIQRNSHYDIMTTSVSLLRCHILRKKQKLHRSLAKISLCLTSIQYFIIRDDLIMTSQQHVHIILTTALYCAHQILYQRMVLVLLHFYWASFQRFPIGKLFASKS